MIIGIGTDVCDITRIKAVLERHGQRYKDRIFTPGEQAYCDARKESAASYAKRWAAKEAFAKALSTADSPHLKWQDVEITNGPSGKPQISLHGDALARLADMTPKGLKGHVHLTLSDELPYALAFVIIEAH
ncbi:MAG: holo-ACP synthase [Robiginitomaculum sp.]